MDESALKVLISNLEGSRATLDSWLFVFTLFVVVGVVLEVVFVIWEYRDELHDWRRGIVHPPEKPSIALLVFGLFGAGLVATGVAGELYIGAKIGAKETSIREANDQRASLLSKLAGDAAQSGRTAHDEVKAVKLEADAIHERLDTASAQLSVMEQQVRVQGPRWKLLEENKATFIEALKPFAGQRVTVVSCGPDSVPEPYKLEQDLINFLGKDGAGWATPGYSRWRLCNSGASAVGGNLLTFNANAGESVKNSAKALGDVLNRLKISTVTIQARPEGRQVALEYFGADWPYELALKDPTAVILLVGTNPTFDFAGWAKRHK
jgi:hypothetical protein